MISSTNSTTQLPSNAYEALMNLSSKLKKKKLLRKPPFANASDEYAALGKQLRRDDNTGGMLHLYSSLCYSAIARCQHALNVRDKEASNYVKSGFVLLQHETDDVDLCVVDWEQYVPDAIHCYEIAIQVYIELNLISLAAASLTELAEALQELRRYSEASKYFQQAARLLEDGVLAVQLLMEAADCELKQREFQRANLLFKSIITVAQKLPDIQHLKTNDIDLLPSFPISISLLLQARAMLVLISILQRKFSEANNALELLIAEIPEDSSKSGGVSTRSRIDAEMSTGGCISVELELLVYLQELLNAAKMKDVVLVNELHHQAVKNRFNSKQCQVIELILNDMK